MDQIAIIDIGSDKIGTAVAAIDKETGSPRIIGFSAVPSKGIKKSQIIDINEASKSLDESITQAERMAGNRINRAIVVVGGPNIQSLNSHGVVAVNYQTNDIQEEDIERVIESARAVSLATTREIIHVLPKEFIVDGQGEIKNPIGMNGVRLEVNTHIVTASTISLNNIRKVCSMLGIDIEGFVFSGLAASYAMLSETEKEIGCMLLDIGAGTTDICVYCDNAVVYTGVIPLGARNVTNDISAGLRISLESSEKVKRYLYQYKDKHPEDTEDEISIASLHLTEKMQNISKKELVEGIIYPRLDELLDFLEREIRQNELIGKMPAGIILTGGGMSTPYLRERMADRFSLPVRTGTPKLLGGVADELTQPEYAALVGAMLFSKDMSSKQGGSFTMPELPKIFSGGAVKEQFSQVVSFFKNFIPGSK